MRIRKRTVGLLLITCLLTVGVVSVYAASSPIDILRELMGKVNEIEEKVDTIQFMATITDLQERIADLETQHAADITELEADLQDYSDRITALAELEADLQDYSDRITALEAAPSGLGAPDYDSGWFGIGQASMLYKTTLANENVFVYMMGREVWEDTESHHQMSYGGESHEYGDDEHHDGAYWEIYSNQLYVVRNRDDVMWPYCRVLVWQLPTPP